MMIDANTIKECLSRGKLTTLPSNKTKKITVLVWLAEQIPFDVIYTEREFNDLLNNLHTFGDPATLRRELYDCSLINRSPDGSVYWLNPERPSLKELLEKHCSAGSGKIVLSFAHEGCAGEVIELSDRDISDAAEFRDRIHSEALERVRQIIPYAESVVDRYSVENYFQQVWDYPGAWYTIVAIPESAGSREALIDTIVRDTIAKYH